MFNQKSNGKRHRGDIQDTRIAASMYDGPKTFNELEGETLRCQVQAGFPPGGSPFYPDESPVCNQYAGNLC